MPRAVLLLLCLAASAWAAAPPSPPGHWALRPPRRPAVPADGRGRNPLDAFLLARLDRAGLRPAAEADRVALARRLNFDLLGLPPSPEEVTAFVEDASPDAYERLVDRLLASPHFGERWAQHWLDVARYADSNGYEGDAERPHAWRYRDWVVRAFNSDLPYDHFVTLQIAGDLLAESDPDGPVAAGFNRCGPIHQVSGNVDPAEIRQEFLTEVVGGVGAAFLGLTMTCARCHDHKFDPIPTRDYYRLEAFFSAARPRDLELATAEEQAAHSRASSAWRAKVAPLKEQIAKLDEPYRARLRAGKLAKLEPAYKAALAVAAAKRTAEQKALAAQAETLVKVTWDEVVAALGDGDRARRAALRERLHRLAAEAPPPPARAWSLEEGKGPLGSFVLRRGSLNFKGKLVTPGVPAVFGIGTTGDRAGLARWLTRPDHPLTARVVVNRLWQHHFGQGIVRTPNDFGLKGDSPSHPELLDWLAAELVESGWSLKHVHRLMVTSDAYRRAEFADAKGAEEIDPDNRLLWRMNRRRLQGEALRDAMLAVTGRLTRWVGGPTVRVPLEPETYELIFTEDEPDGLWPVTPDVRQHDRRSLYLFNKRNVRLPLLEAFDQPDALTTCPVRPVSTFAPQALVLMNGPFAQGQAKAFASRLYREAGTAAARVERAYRLALGRGPTAKERVFSEAFVREQAELLRDRLRARRAVALVEDLPEGADLAEAAALSDLCLALMNRNGFVHH